MGSDSVPDDIEFLNVEEKDLWIRGNGLMSKVTWLKTNKWYNKDDKKAYRQALRNEFDDFIKDYKIFQQKHSKYGFKAKFNVIQLKAVKNMI